MMTMDEFKAGNKAANLHYFDADTMRFFSSRIVNDSWNGDGYFITSEQFRGISSPDGPRLYSIRKGDLHTFSVQSIGEFQAYSSLARAKSALKRIRRAQPVSV